MKVIFTILVVFFASFNALAQQWGGDLSGSAYDGRSQVRNVGHVEMGQVLEVRQIQINVPPAYGVSGGQAVGGALGGLLGGVAGNSVGRGKGRLVATAVGGIVGAVGGSAVGDRVTRDQRIGVEFLIQMNRGEVVSVTQEVDPDAEAIVPGDNVRLIMGNGVTRVVKMRRYASY